MKYYYFRNATLYVLSFLVPLLISSSLFSGSAVFNFFDTMNGQIKNVAFADDGGDDENSDNGSVDDADEDTGAEDDSGANDDHDGGTDPDNVHDDATNDDSSNGDNDVGSAIDISDNDDDDNDNVSDEDIFVEDDGSPANTNDLLNPDPSESAVTPTQMSPSISSLNTPSIPAEDTSISSIGEEMASEDVQADVKSQNAVPSDFSIGSILDSNNPRDALNTYIANLFGAYSFDPMNVELPSLGFDPANIVPSDPGMEMTLPTSPNPMNEPSNPITNLPTSPNPMNEPSNPISSNPVPYPPPATNPTIEHSDNILLANPMNDPSSISSGCDSDTQAISSYCISDKINMPEIPKNPDCDPSIGVQQCYAISLNNPSSLGTSSPGTSDSSTSPNPKDNMASPQVPFTSDSAPSRYQ